MRTADYPVILPLRLLCLVLALWSLLACGGDAPEESRESPGPAPGSTEPGFVEPEPKATGSQTQDREKPLVVFLGDSLTAGYGLDEEQAYPSLVASGLEERGLAVQIVNAGVSGDTTAGGLRRLDWLLRQNPDVLVVALGGNDGLRGVDLETSDKNLREIIATAQEHDVVVLLAGMLIPPNYGEDYARQFAELYPRLATELEVALIPFLLENVAAQPDLNLPDGIHPNVEGQRLVAQTVLDHLVPILENSSK